MSKGWSAEAKASLPREPYTKLNVVWGRLAKGAGRRVEKPTSPGLGWPRQANRSNRGQAQPITKPTNEEGPPSRDMAARRAPDLDRNRRRV